MANSSLRFISMPSVGCRTVDLCRRRSIEGSTSPGCLLARLCRTPDQGRAQRSYGAALLPGHTEMGGIYLQALAASRVQ